jgi:predicted GNAT family N-acyltransferase
VTSHQVQLSHSGSVPASARALIWDTFFVSRKRGVDLLSHFPWIEQESHVVCLSLFDLSGGVCVATLVLRSNTPWAKTPYAMLGMVCVDPAWRGRGYCTQLLSHTTDFAARNSIHSIVLWTTQPGLYAKFGFAEDTDVCDTYGRVEINPQRRREPVEYVRADMDASVALPPFGRQLIRFQSRNAEVISVETPDGLVVADWKGEISDVMGLIESALPSAWGLNAPAASLVHDELTRRGHRYRPLPCATRMVRHTGRPERIPYISILDRI